MFILIRKFNLRNYQYYVKVIELMKTRELHILSPVNLRITRSFCSMHLNSNILNDRIRKCLDHLADVYKNKKDNLLDFTDLNITSSLLNERAQLKENIQSLQSLAKQDLEIKKLAEEEEILYKEHLDQVDEKLIDMILSNICNKHYNDIIIEIIAGVGGQEAMLFVKDLYEMYMGYAKYLDLYHEVMDIELTDNNGVRNVSIMVSGKQANKFLYEGGVHRVQRIPATEKLGRVHTSTASVAVLPAPSDVEIVINEKDLKIDTKRATGAGGQHVNTTDSAVRITHIPTGLVVNCQVHRSQGKNKKMAMMKLRSMLYEQQLNKQTSFISELRHKQMGLGLRNEKIRTYNYNQDRITDHRLQNGTVYNLVEFMQGGIALKQLEDRLHKEIQMKTLLEIVKKVEMRFK